MLSRVPGFGRLAQTQAACKAASAAACICPGKGFVCAFSTQQPGAPQVKSIPPTRKIAVLGSGSFGTAMGTVLARNGNQVTLLGRNTDTVRSIQTEHRNPQYLTQYPLPFNLGATTDPAKALEGCSYIVHSVPVQASKKFLQDIKEYIPADVPIISTSKGLHTETLQVMSDLIPEALGRDQPTALFSGPTFAKELLEGWPTGAVAASRDEALAKAVAQLFASAHVRVWTTTDVVGVEVGGALKNVYAIASGVLEGLGLGYNTTALLVTRAVAEMNALAVAMGSRQATLAGLSGVGDLMLTCFGSLSRNRSVGVKLGQGMSLQEVLDSMSEAAEGVATTPAALALAKRHGVDVPIIEAMAGVLAGSVTPTEAVMGLMRLGPVEGEVIFDMGRQLPIVAES